MDQGEGRGREKPLIIGLPFLLLFWLLFGCFGALFTQTLDFVFVLERMIAGFGVVVRK